MSDTTARTCPDCDGAMAPIVITYKGMTFASAGERELEYRQPDDSRNFWTGKYPTAGKVQAFMCGECGRINLYGGVSVANEKEG